jgi:Zn-dependent protease
VFVYGDARLRGNSQTSYALAINLGLLPEEMVPTAGRNLVGRIEAKGGHLSAGFVGLEHLLPALTRAGQVGVAYRLLTNTTYPSWGYSIENGATTIWERWDSWTRVRAAAQALQMFGPAGSPKEEAGAGGPVDCSRPRRCCMFGTRWRLFRLLGIPISVDASWLIILALLTLNFARAFPALLYEFFPGAPRALPWYEYWVMGLITAVAFFLCVLLHELGHSVVARARGMSIRGITLFLFGGVAEIADEPPSAGTEFLMAIAGPAVSLVLAILFAVLASVGGHSGWPPPLVLMLGYLCFINGLVLVFNLIPAFPLDGGRVLRSILWAATGNLRRATYWAALGGQAFAWLLIAWGIYQFFWDNWLGGIWSGLIGLFLSRAAQGSYQQVLVRQALQGEPVRRFMKPEPVTVPPSLDLRTWVDDYVYRYHWKGFPVMSDGHLEGIITTQALASMPRSEWAGHTVGEVMDHDVQAVAIDANADALEALEKMQRSGSGRLLVTEGDRLVGIVSLKDLLRFLNLKLELDGADASRPETDNAQPPWQQRQTLAHH